MSPEGKLPASPPPAAFAPRAGWPRVWHFGEAVVDERTLELTVAGRRVPLERKPLEVLILLLQRAGSVVTKAELADALWPGRGVTDSNLTKCIAVIRLALMDHAHEQIKTAHGYGYRFAMPVFVERHGGGEAGWMNPVALIPAPSAEAPR